MNAGFACVGGVVHHDGLASTGSCRSPQATRTGIGLLEEPNSPEQYD